MKSVLKKKTKAKSRAAKPKNKKIISPKPKQNRQNPSAKIAAKIRPQVLNAPAVEAAVQNFPAGKEALPLVPTRKKTKIESVEPEFEVKKTKIRIIGIGGGGSNIVSEIADKVKKSSFYIANTDFAALRNAPKTVSTFQFGESFTHGLGTGMDPRVAEEAAAAEKEEIKKMMEGQDLVIIVASLGGGAGSGAAPIFAQISKGLGNLTYGIFTLPFEFEGAKKSEIAKNALEKLKPYLNALTILPNERVFEVVPKTTPFSKTLSYINSTLSDGLQGLVETVYDTGMINIDFADLRAILAGNGKMAFLNSVSFKKGSDASLDSFEKAFSSPLYPYGINKARGLLLNIVAQKDLKLLEVNKILTSVANRINKDARIIFGVGHEGADANTVKVTVLATGCAYAGAGNNDDNGDSNGAPTPKILPAPAPKRPAAEAGSKSLVKGKIRPVLTKKQKTAKKKSKSAAGFEKKPEKTAIKIKIAVPGKGNPQADLLDKAIDREISDIGQAKSGIESQFEAPVRKNALQVKKEVELEEKRMLDQEKIWEVPAFLRKKNKI